MWGCWFHVWFWSLKSIMRAVRKKRWVVETRTNYITCRNELEPHEDRLEPMLGSHCFWDFQLWWLRCPVVTLLNILLAKESKKVKEEIWQELLHTSRVSEKISDSVFELHMHFTPWTSFLSSFISAFQISPIMTHVVCTEPEQCIVNAGKWNYSFA